MSHTTLSLYKLRCYRMTFSNLRSHEDFEVVDVLLLDQLLDLGLDGLVPGVEADLGGGVASRVLVGVLLPSVERFHLKFPINFILQL